MQPCSRSPGACCLPRKGEPQAAILVSSLASYCVSFLHKTLTQSTRALSKDVAMHLSSDCILYMSFLLDIVPQMLTRGSKAERPMKDNCTDPTLCNDEEMAGGWGKDSDAALDLGFSMSTVCCQRHLADGRGEIACDHVSADSLATDSSSAKQPWSVCLDDRFGLAHQIRNKQCRLYSLGLGRDDTQFEVSMANSGCEVHRFDPSVKSAHVLENQRLWYHRLSIDWRDPHPAVAALKPHSNTRKLGTILNEFGHHKIDVLKADLESAEWKVLENLILEDVLEQIGQLVFEIHLHWPGFEVSGGDSSVVRFWYSLLKELELNDFRLFHSYKDLSKPQLFLKKDMFNASSCYTLGWVNTRWK
ncbi:hypothetical protein MDA_GLEAN10001846 [Myotis davidii]|uniref:Methyltransferase domain-containing protein n=1 Tax=Myotis davidii TaxID=225400 RepID=L5MJW0_MYODS|nr:hypothetical protein MDA_GLEAN10001846 [Myotis davidii]